MKLKELLEVIFYFQPIKILNQADREIIKYSIYKDDPDIEQFLENEVMNIYPSCEEEKICIDDENSFKTYSINISTVYDFFMF